MLRNVHLRVGKNEFVALLGANGAGKTTLLGAISRVMGTITAGTIAFEGTNIERMPPHKVCAMGIAQVPEGRRIFPYLSVEENILVGAYQLRAWRHRRAALERAFQLFPVLKERRHAPARLLSGGEQQMLVIARGLASRPKLLMVDEPSLGLAPKVLEEVYRVLGVLCQEEGVSILLAEQNAHYALAVARRGYVMQEGEIVLEGTTEQLLRSELVKKAYLGR